MEHIVVVGAGQAGASLVAKLRSEGFEGDISLIGAEKVPPYQRPPLSKAYLLGEMPEERLYLRPAAFYEDQRIDLQLDRRVVAIDPAAKTITCDDDEVISYDQLALTVGAHPRTLPAAIGGNLDGVFAVRNLADADAMSPAFVAGKHVLIIGGGYIGLEAAAVAAKLGLKVTLVEMADRILQRVAAPETSDYFRALHRAHGVDIREGVGLDRLLGDDCVTGARLTDGTELDIDFAVVGVGINPATILADSAGLVVENGIATDSHGRTSDPHIWAAGDCATCLFAGAPIRLESVGNAIDQAEAVAKNMLGQDQPYVPKPWFWSDQYDCKLQIAGLNMGYTDVYIRKGDAPGVQSHWYYKGDELIAVDAMNDARNYMIGKRLIESGRSPAPAVITDPATDMKALLKS
ncbi:NAD(P)/FAD-dependent oxidoreductase [Yoonia sediminilitoris]|uniref:3-phenylpropionate/trans-cinnamate dioxygenase ferredoxin reductase subunit n=1 Tax=Yoonia sediminilitoris TaxID=1286148 RepID=A0A2T6KII2_9RHOB|nr:FAD-dependent oxidoreductase [Yoonia sediminilitoris]PUB15530.1 3-phenylpropionate/trans-cinnamate dioxygenase ferredoxin reductase subunit [Yoonia sediminilitoris]RCW96139.1 3-phenylpropionate/trans-cinnamate dioxygenase ferredoxin reductase subunit [Yoonia sediminilitoris]